MPSRSVRQERPTAYLDTSTLCHAFRSCIASSAKAEDRAFAPLVPWIERVANEANLCLSGVHLAELSRWHDHATADAVAKWLDALPIVWVRSFVDVQKDEDEYWTRMAAGSPGNRVSAFAPSMLTAIGDVGTLASPEALTASRLPEMLRVYRQADAATIRLNVEGFALRFHSDREWAVARGFSELQKEEELAWRHRRELREKADNVFGQIYARGEHLPSVLPDGTHLQDRLVRLVEEDHQAMPSWRVIAAFSRAWADSAGRRTPGSNSFQALNSSFEDYMHLAVGAAYCDIFTCDADASACIGSARSNLGHAPQLTVKGSGGPSGFVSKLTSVWP